MTPSEQFREREESGHEMSERIDQERRFGNPVTGPQWYRRDEMPEIPGLWVLHFDRTTTRRGFNEIAADTFTAEDFARGAPFHCDWVYGPIPERMK